MKKETSVKDMSEKRRQEKERERGGCGIFGMKKKMNFVNCFTPNL